MTESESFQDDNLPQDDEDLSPKPTKKQHVRKPPTPSPTHPAASSLSLSTSTAKKSRLSTVLGNFLYGPRRRNAVPPEELDELLSCTNFTEREIRAFYCYATDDGGGTLGRLEFARVCLDHGIKSPELIDRMFAVFDADASDGITHLELVKGLNPLLRGSREDVANLYFSLYEVDNDGLLSAEEIIAVYSDMVFVSDDDRKHGLTSQQKKRIVEWVDQQKKESPDGKLDRETFVKAVLAMEDDNGHHKPTLCRCRTAYYVFLTAWFEMGVSFALPAMGALSDRIKERFDTDDTGIGALTSAYYFAAMVGPLIGGLFMDKYGPGIVVIGANVIVSAGAACQAIANGPSQFWLLFLGRLLLGFGGEMTPFTTVEILGRLFPDYFGLMAGVRNLVQSTSGFLAFLLLPIWADSFSGGDNEGTSFALWMCFVLAIVSLVACIITKISMNKEDSAKAASSEQQSDQLTITKTMRAFAQATAPAPPIGCEKWKLPFSFYLACIGIKAQYFAPFAFTAFSNEIYTDKFGQSKTTASIQTGVISLVAGLMGPPMGALSDKYGQRALSLIVACLLSMVGFIVLAIATGGSTAVWVASILFALQYGFGDTVAYISIRFIVGVDRAGIGYGIYGILGNLVAAVVPVVGGTLLDQSGGEELVCWYFGGLMLFGAFCWLAVRMLEGSRSLLELPEDKIIETSDKDFQVAALSYIIAPPAKPTKKE